MSRLTTILCCSLVLGSALTGQEKKADSKSPAKRSAEQTPPKDPFAAGDPFAAPQKSKRGKKKKGGNPFGDDDPFGDLKKKAAGQRQADKPKGRDPFSAPARKGRVQKTNDPFGDDNPFDGKKPTVKKRVQRKPRAAGKLVPIAVALEQPTTLEFFDSPLSECVDYLRDRNRVAIYVDGAGLDDIGLETDAPVNMNVAKISLRQALNLLCDQLNLAWTIKNEVIFLTSGKRARENARTVVYKVSRVVGSASPPVLVKVLQSLVDSGEETPAVFARGNSVIVTGSERDHHLCLGLLKSLRIHAEADSIDKSDATRRVKLYETFLHPSKQTTELAAALNQKTRLEFFDAPLSEVGDYLRQLHKVLVYLDQKSLEQIGVTVDTPATVNLSNVSFRSGLHLMLGQLQTTWVVEDGAIKIVSQNDARWRPAVRVYYAGDLLSQQDTLDSLATTVRQILKHPRQPSRNDRRQVNSFGATLIVAATEAGHEKTAKLLADLRKAKQSPTGR